MVTKLSLKRLSARLVARCVGVLAVVVVSFLFGYGGYERRWAGDDGFINLRVVSHLLEGNGFVFNAGERSEAVTSAAWVFLLWGLGELGCNLDSAAWISALVLSVTGMLMASAGAARVTARADQEPSFVLPIGILAYAAIPVAWDYATSALENGIGLAFLGTAYCLVGHALNPRHRGEPWRLQLGSAAFVGFAPLVRPDFALYAPAPLLLLLASTTTWKKRAVLAFVAGIPGVGYQLFRMGYFASLVPNTAIAKEAFAARWDQGLLYFNNTFVTYELRVPVLLAVLALGWTLFELARRKEWLRALLPLSFFVSGLLHIVYVVRVGGDFMHGRMLLPGLFALFSAAGVLRVPFRWSSGAPALAGFVAMAFWAHHCAKELRPGYFVDQILDERQWYSDSSKQPHPTHLKHYSEHMFYVGPLWAKGKIAEGCASGMAALANDSTERCERRVAWPDAAGGLLVDRADGDVLSLEPASVTPNVVAVYEMRPIGIIGRLMGLRINVVDLYGLADPLASRMELPVRGRPGHEKTFPAVWFAAKYAAPGATRDERVQVAKRALQCGSLRELHAATHDRLTLSRFIRNLGLAFSLHRVRVPADPALALKRFCES